MISGSRPEQPAQTPHSKATVSPVPQRQLSTARRAATSRPPNAIKASSLSSVSQLPINPPATSIPPVPGQTLSPNNNDNNQTGPPLTTHPSEHPQNTALTLPAQRRLKAPLRKSLSDPTALTGQTSLQPRPAPTKSSLSTLAERDEPHDQGPWSAEALDLFDFWPPGRPKPI
ncbi:hypothetical protein N7510_003168 [Penicillium lagena]|uniref:uncharacterized protein n=1 Tax=Penicillium lagena TaxID=94218 RepID=UPI00253F817F|nr:uncharacterized protein N7510_003168 [Penicillium lagena]KAJ5619184.1 hypothetical protein N7510_003168 [Penicillium lagena]